MEDPRGISSHSELHLLFVIKLNHINVTRIKEAMMQRIEKALAKVFELGFHAAIEKIRGPLRDSRRCL